jgi:glucose/arabinose dehydrogenase
MIDRRTLMLGAAAGATAGVAGISLPGRAQAQEVTTEAGAFRLEAIADGLENPWGFAFLPEGGMLVTERPGRLRLVDGAGRLSAPIRGLPGIAARGQGGLLDVALDPAYADNRRIYLTYSEPRERGNGTAVLRAVLTRVGAGATLEDPTVIFRQMPNYSSNNHFGSRIAFAPDGAMFVTLGDRYGGMDQAQTLDNHLGKVVRITTDGAPAPGNPFLGREGALPEIWSYGHRNPQSAAINPATGELWTIEHGARGGDEVNIPRAGRNYGWPVITYGRDYSGARIGEGTRKEGMEQPVFYWDPSIAPSGMAFYDAAAVPAWRGSLFVGALRGQMLVRLTLDGDAVTAEERMLRDLGERIRDVRHGPDGALYLATDSEQGRILRLGPPRTG